MLFKKNYLDRKFISYVDHTCKVQHKYKISWYVITTSEKN